MLRNSFIMIVGALLLLGATEQKNTKGTVVVTTINCIESLHTQPQVSYLRMNDPSMPHAFLHGSTGLEHVTTQTGRELAPGLHEFTLHLAPGNYEIYASAKGCWGGQVMALVLPDRTHSTSLVLGGFMTMLFDHDHAGLAGTISIPHARLELIDPKGLYGSPFVDVEDGAFYVDSLQRRKWVLRVWPDCCQHADFPIDLSGVRPGDYVTVALNASDVRAREGYSGPLFSDPGAIAPIAGGAWYTNYGRSTVGFVHPDGTHIEYELPRGGEPYGIMPDAEGGAWFSRGDGLIWHIDSAGHVTSVDPGIGDHAKRNDSTRTMLLDKDGSLLVVLEKLRRIVRIDTKEHLSNLSAPNTIDLDQAGTESDGTRWFNVRDKNDLARVDGAALTIISADPVKLSPKVRRINGAFYEIDDPGQRSPRLTAVHGQYDASNEDEQVVSDGHGGVWLARCYANSLEHINSDGHRAVFSSLGCPEYAVADGNGGLWFLADRATCVYHIAESDSARREPDWRNQRRENHGDRPPQSWRDSAPYDRAISEVPLWQPRQRRALRLLQGLVCRLFRVRTATRTLYRRDPGAA